MYGSPDHETLSTELPDVFQARDRTVDQIPGTALFTEPDENGEVAYEGYTRVHWDSQETQTGEHQLPLVTCGEHDGKRRSMAIERWASTAFARICSMSPERHH